VTETSTEKLTGEKKRQKKQGVTQVQKLTETLTETLTEKLKNSSIDNASAPTGRKRQVESNGNEGDGEKKRHKKQGATQVQNVTRVETIEALTKEKRVNSDAEDLFPLSESLHSRNLEEDDSDFEPSDEEPDDDFEYDSNEASEAKSTADGSGFSIINKGMEEMELEGKEGIGLDPQFRKAEINRVTTTLDGIARGARQRKATKSDDAEVPEYLWEEHLMQDGPTPWNVKTTDMVQLRKGVKLMRHLMLGWWKNKVTRSFLLWAGARYKEIAEVDMWADKVLGGRTKPATKNNIGVTSQGSTYGWSVDGKEEHHIWWRKRHASLGKDLEAGADAVERAANSSWWTWDDGLRPFHLRWPPWYMKTIRDGLEVHF
jgi:hypothetical protein